MQRTIQTTFIRTIIIIGFIFSGISSIFSQDVTGKEFWLTPTGGRFYIDQSTKIMVVGNYDAVITVNFEALPHPASPLNVNYCTFQTVNHVGGQVTIITIPSDNLANCARYVDDLQAPETVQKNGCHITSTAPIAIYYTHYQPSSGECTPVNPVERLGTEYYISAFRENSTDNYWAALSTVVATENNTVVTFKLSDETWTSAGDGTQLNDTVVLHKPNSTWSVTLQKGETYSVVSIQDGLAASTGNTFPWGSTVPNKWNSGLNGLKINSTKNISVFGGSPITRIGDYEYVACSAGDITFTHHLPTNNWGTKFVATQTLLRTYNIVGLKTPAPPHFENYPATSADKSLADYLLITAKDNNTVVNIGGRSSFTKTINAGEFFLYESPGKSAAVLLNPGQVQNTVTSDKPIQVVQLMKGGYCDGAVATNGGDPDQMWVFKEDYFTDNYLITNPTDYTSNFIVLIIKEPTGGNEARTSISLIVGGSPVAVPPGVSASPLNDGTGGWSQMGTSGYWFQRVPLSTTGIPIRVRSVPATPTSPTYPFAFYLSGGLGAGSYGYMGGASCQMDVFAHADTINLCTTAQAVLIMDSTTNGGSIGGVKIYNYTWTVYDGATVVATNTGVGVNPTYNFTPPGPGTYLGILQITDNAGCSARDSFNIVVMSTPPLATISYPKNNYCKNEPNASPVITGTTGGTFSSTAGLTINAATGVIDLGTSTAGAYTVSYTYGIVPCTSLATFSITVNNVPTITATDSTICSGSTENITTVVSPTGGTYLWSPGNQTTSGISVTPSSTSNYTVSYTLNGCVATDVATVTVNPTPTVTSTDTTICTGSSGTLTAVGNPTGGSYLWSPGGATTAMMTASPTATTTYNVVYTLTGCTANAIGTITVQSIPTATMSGGGNICPSQTAPITVNFTGNGPFNLTYTNGTTSNTVSGISANPYTFNTNVAGNYSITNLTNGTCTGTFSGSANVSVSSPISISNSSAVCSGGNADYTVSFQLTGGNPATYAVTGMTGGTISAGPPYIFTSNPIPAGTTNYSFNITDGANCNPFFFSGTKNCLCPTEATISGGGTICAGETATITINLTGTQPFNFTYTDGTTPTTITGHTTTSYSFTTGTAGNYSLTSVSDATACGGSVSGNAQVIVNSSPAYMVNNPTVCNGTAATVTVAPSVSGGSYLWTAPAAVTGMTTQSVNVTPSTTTKYYMTYTLNGCSRSDSSLVTVNPIPTVTVNPTTVCQGTPATVTTSVGTSGGFYFWNYPATVASQTTPSVTDNPSTTTNYNVTYTLNGCSAQSTGTATVSATPVISVNPATATICSGTSVTLTASSTVTGGSYAWTPGSFTTPSITVSPTTTTTYSAVHSISGCSSNTANSTVTVNPAVTATASSNSPVCSGDSLKLSVNTTAGATYSWSGPNGFTSSANNPNILNATAANSGTYIVTVTVNGCSATSSISAIVSALPVISVSASANPICAGSPTTLAVASNIAGGTYTWTPGPLSSNQTVTVSPAATTTYSVSQMVGSCVSNTATITITVNANPVATPSSNSPVCAGSSLTLFGNTLTNATYQWSGPGFSEIEQNPTIAPSQTTNSGSYTLIVTQNSCVSAPVSINVTVNPVPNTTITAVGPQCTNSAPTTLNAASSGGTWTGNGITNSTLGTFDPSIAGPGTHTISYSVGGACPSASTTSIVVNEVPNIQFTAINTISCTPSNVNFTNTISPTPQTVLWNFGDGATSNVIGNVSHNYFSAGSYTVSLTATANGCTSTLSQPNYITINPNPVAAFKPNTGNGNTVSFTNLSSGATSYLWDFSNGNSSTEENPTETYSSIGTQPTIQLIAYSAAGCTDTIRVTIELVEEVLYFIPNAFTPDGDPNNQYFLPVLAAGIDIKSYKMFIFNRWGEQIFQTNDHMIGWDGTFNNQLVQAGTYTWSIQFLDKNTDKRYKFEGSLNLLK
jgi:gliding motility-associated-like protein